MSDIDVGGLADEQLQQSQFPASGKSDFRFHISPEVHQGISKHAKQDTSVEICGVLVGLWYQDDDGPYAVAEDFIRCESATSKFAEVTFTHESWSQINSEMDSRFEDKRIVGWYHSHPDFGIFLSDRDCFIHEHFFSGPGQVAYVVDPVRDLEGVFAWKNGKPTPISHYWIGNTIRTVEASIRNPAAEAAKEGSANAQGANGIGPAEEPGFFSYAATPLALLALFLLGYLLAGMKSSWERQAIVDGVVFNYTDFRLTKLGLREELAEVQKFLASATKQMKSMPTETNELSEEQLKELANDRKLLIGNLLGISKRLDEVSSRYSFDDRERRALAELSRRLQAKQLKILEQADKERKSQSDEKGTVPESNLKKQTTPIPLADKLPAAPSLEPRKPELEVPDSPEPDER